MFGMILNNRAIIDLVKRSELSITGFDERKIKTVHYPLFPGQVIARGEKEDPDRKEKIVVHDFIEQQKPYIFQANEYMIIRSRENITPPKGVVGHFVPSSNLIDLGFQLVAGRVEYPWGRKGEQLRLGIKNLLPTPNALTGNEQIAHVYFIDVRGLANLDAVMTERDLELFKRWVVARQKADDDGPSYE